MVSTPASHVPGACASVPPNGPSAGMPKLCSSSVARNRQRSSSGVVMVSAVRGSA